MNLNVINENLMTFLLAYLNVNFNFNIFVYGSLICIFFMNTFGKWSIVAIWGRLKIREWKMREQTARVENAGVGKPYGKPNRYYMYTI